MTVYQNSARFRTTLDFDRKYLQKGSRHRQAENGVINRDTFAERNLMNFGPQTTKFKRLKFTHPKSTCSEDPILALGGVVAQIFTHAI